MLRIIAVFVSVIVTNLSYGQSLIQEGDVCFDRGDYVCALSHYGNAFKNSVEGDKQIAEIKLTRAKWCADHLKTANQAFAINNYIIAKDEYQKVLDSNPKDTYAKSQFEKCQNALNPIKFRKATAADIRDIWNNVYDINPKRRENLIKAGIDPDDAQRRINAGEGKPPEKEKEATYLGLSKNTLYFSSYGETSNPIMVYTDVSSFFVPWAYTPSWCTVNQYAGYFTVTATANPNTTSRSDWIKVASGGKEVRLDVVQYGRNEPQSPSVQNPTLPKQKRSKYSCFNCPKSKDKLGITFGYSQQNIDNYFLYVIQLGFKVEALYKYGFGLNSGIDLFGFSENLLDNKLNKNTFDAYALHIPIHLEYRLNFSKWFNPFGYSGIGINVTTNPSFENYSLPATYEYGGGFRIKNIQLNAGRSLYLDNLRNEQNLGKYRNLYQKYALSVSYMF